MRFMFLNHSHQRHPPDLEEHILRQTGASPETSFEVAYAEDFGGNEVLRLLEERKALSGLHYILVIVGTLQGH